MAFEWGERTMGTGVASLDEQHRELIRIVNQLMDAGYNQRGRSEVGQTLEFLGKYVREHFAREEELMDLHNCPVATQNKQAHQAFLVEFDRLARRFEDEGPTQEFIFAVRTRLVDWLIRHISMVDTRLRGCVEAEAA